MTARLDALLRTGPFHLARHGSTVSMSTLSAWQQGRVRPTSPRSLDVVTDLEQVLGVRRGALLELLATTGAGGRPELMDGFRANDLEIVARHERVHIDEHRRAGRVRSHVVVRARRNGVDRFYAHFYGEPETVLENVTTKPLAHCRLGVQARDPGAFLLVSELLFDHVLSAGDTWVLEFETYDPDTSACTDFAHGTRGFDEHCLIEVRFHAGVLPIGTYAYALDDADGEPRRIADLAVQDAAVHHVERRLTSPWIGIRWRWPAEA